MNRSGMYGNRGVGTFAGSQQGFLGNANMLMGNQMAALGVSQSDMRNLLNQGGPRDLRANTGLFPMNPSLGMRELQQPGGFNINSRVNMPSQPSQLQDPVLDILVIS